MLQTQELSIGYQTPLLPPLSLALRQGQLTVLLGANGVGKSSLLRTLAGLQKPLAGKAHIAGKDVMRYSPTDLAKQLSLVLTDKPQDLYLTVEDTLAMGRFPYMRWYQRLQASDKSVITNVLELTQTQDLLHKRLATLSDGQLQKVMIARALVQDTPIVLLDEPTAHLDLPNRFMIFQLLRDLARQTQKAILVATHDLEPSLQTADQMWLLDKGKCFVGLPEALVLEGVVGRVFGNATLAYNAVNDKFQLVQTPLAYLQLTGEGIAYTQTHKALARLGIGIEANAEVHIRILPAPAGWVWEWVGKESFETLESLCEKVMLMLPKTA